MVREADRDDEPWLLPGEHLLAHCTRASLDRRLPGLTDEPPSGQLFVTSERLVLAGAVPVSIALDDIEEAGRLDEGVVLLMRGGMGISIRCDRPRLMRAEIAAARAARTRAAGGSGRFSDLRDSGLLPRPGS